MSVDLRDFELIDACGMPGVLSTSITRERGEPATAPSTESARAAAAIFAREFAAAIGAPLDGA